MAACLTSPSCVAVDVGPVGCVLHNNADDLTAAYNASGVTQFVLNRHCLHTSSRPTTRTTTVAAENFTVSTGNKINKNSHTVTNLPSSPEIVFC